MPYSKWQPPEPTNPRAPEPQSPIRFFLFGHDRRWRFDQTEATIEIGPCMISIVNERRPPSWLNYFCIDDHQAFKHILGLGGVILMEMYFKFLRSKTEYLQQYSSLPMLISK